MKQVEKKVEREVAQGEKKEDPIIEKHKEHRERKEKIKA
jgi:hypothetical protein